MLNLFLDRLGIDLGRLALQHGLVQQAMIGLIYFNQLRLRTGNQV